jgi:hypothetical protein
LGRGVAGATPPHEKQVQPYEHREGAALAIPGLRRPFGVRSDRHPWPVGGPGGREPHDDQCRPELGHEPRGDQPYRDCDHIRPRRFCQLQRRNRTELRRRPAPRHDFGWRVHHRRNRSPPVRLHLRRHRRHRDGRDPGLERRGRGQRRLPRGRAERARDEDVGRA